MEIGGILADAFRLVFGNSDVIVSIGAFTFIVSFCLIVIEIYKYLRG